MKLKHYLFFLGLLFCLPIFGQNLITIKGTVTDGSLKGPLPGVSVLIKGTQNATSADFDGNYVIKAKSNDVLVFSFIGYKTVDIPVGGKTTINVTLIAENNQLDEVVVIGYGTAKRKDLTGSVASLKGKDIADYPVTNVATAMQGKIAGVTITATDGRPNASVSIRVRGGTSITQSNDPLFIVDGFPVGSINDIPPSQIASIDVLKDASATAIYGARGANGVILITTKAPTSGKITVSYSGATQIKMPAKYLGAENGYDFVKTNWDYGTLFNLGDTWAKAYGLGTAYASLNPAGIDAYKTAPYRDLEKDVLRNTTMLNHSVNISGGNEKTKYSLSYDFLNDNGIKIESYYKRTNIIGKLKSEIAKNLDLNADIYYSDENLYGNDNQTNGIGSLINRALRFTPVTPLGDISGNNTQLGLYDNYVRPEYDPIGIVKDIYDNTLTQTFRGNASLNWKVTDGLTLHSEYGASKQFKSRYLYTGAFAKSTVGVQGGDATVTKTYGTGYRFLNTANYKFNNLGLDHDLNILAGQEINSKDSEVTQVAGLNYPIAFGPDRVFANMYNYGLASSAPLNNSKAVPYHLASFFGRLNYTFKGKYLFTATLRADGSSNFGSANKWGYFPAAAFAWRASDESFLKDSKTISNLKFRLSYGEAGNDQIPPFSFAPVWSGTAAGYSYNNVANPEYNPYSTTLTNPDLKWETTTTRNFGIDYGLFNSRLYGTIDAYWNTTKDLLLPESIPAYTGYSTQWNNVAQTRNIGLEFTLGGDIIKNEDFKLSANANIAFNRNKVESLTDAASFVNYVSGWSSSTVSPSNGDYTFQVGQPVGLIRGYVSDGFYTTADFDYNATTKAYTLKPGVANSSTVLGASPGLGAYPGVIKLKKLGTTLNATNISETDDATIIGNTNPKFTGGMNFTGNYKSLDFLVGFNGSYGNQIYNASKLAANTGYKAPFRNYPSSAGTAYTLFDVDATGNLVRVYDPTALDALNVNATGPMPFNEVGVVQSSGIEDGSFLRLNNITLGYTLPSVISQKVSMSNFRVYATMTNVHVWTKYTGYDPEVDAGNGRNATYPTPGMDFGTYPKAITFTLGINAKF